MKTISPKGVTRRLWQRWYTALAVVGVAGLFGAVAYAVHDLNIFELEGNAVKDTTGDDWIQIYCDSIDPDRTGVCSVGSGDPKLDGTPASNALVTTFFYDPFDCTDCDDVIVGGKDTLDIEAGVPQDWQWKLGGANDKNDIEHVFAALYRDDDPDSDSYGDFILYFGLDKLSNNGDANVGFWFLQNEVEQLGDGVQTTDPCVPSGCPFSDGHKQGDVFVAAPITSGGETTTIDVYTWGPNALDNVPVAPSQGDLTLATSGAECSTIVGPDNVCGQPNNDDVAAPWPYQFKFSGGTAPSDSFPTATFFEAGLNLSALFEGAIPCISTLMAETRQSQSETANLEDKAIGSFDLCSIKVRKEGPALAKVGDPAQFVITITNDGALPLTQVSIIDDKLGVLTGQGDCGVTLQPDTSCTIVVDVAAIPGGEDPRVNTVTATYTRGADEVSGTASHEVNLFTPSVTIDKKADGSDGPVTIDQGDVVAYSAKVTNTSSSDTPNLSCDVTDNQVDGNLNQTGVILTPSAMQTFNQSVAFNFLTSNPFSWCTQQSDGTFSCKNTATVSCSPAGFTNVVGDSDMVEVIVVPAQVLLTVVKDGDAYGKVGDPVDYTITVFNNNENEAVTLTSIMDTLLGNLGAANALVTANGCWNSTDGFVTLTANDGMEGGTDECTITATRNVIGGMNPDPDPLPNEVTVTGEDQFGNAGQAVDDHSVDLVAPSYTLTKSCVQEPITVGDFANFQIDIVNTGDVNLVIDVSDPDLGIDEMDVVLGERDGTACGAADFDPTGMGIGADAADGCLRFEEGVLVTAPGDITNTVNVSATLPAVLDLSNQIDQMAGDTCTVEVNEVTRTWGFWKTHGGDPATLPDFPDGVEKGFTCYVFETALSGFMDLGWKKVYTCEELFDVFWASPARDSNGDKRSQLCRTKLHASHQLAAAILNTGLGTPAPDAIDLLVEELEGRMKRKVIIDLANDLAAFNESGDDAMIEADVEIPHADPRGTRTTAETGFMDCNGL